MCYKLVKITNVTSLRYILFKYRILWKLLFQDISFTRKMSCQFIIWSYCSLQPILCVQALSNICKGDKSSRGYPSTTQKTTNSFPLTRKVKVDLFLILKPEGHFSCPLSWCVKDLQSEPTLLFSSQLLWELAISEYPHKHCLTFWSSLGTLACASQTYIDGQRMHMSSTPIEFISLITFLPMLYVETLLLEE